MDSVLEQHKPARSFKLRHAVETDVGRRRNENQDAFGFAQTAEATLYIVADGMGGARGGATASTIAVNVIARRAFELDGNITEEGLRHSIQTANKLIHAFGITDETLSGMGTTVVALAFVGKRAVVAYVGDSRIYHFRGDGSTQLSRDHTLVQELVDSGALAPEEAENHPVAHMLTRSLGPLGSVDVETGALSTEVAPGDKFLLCCDGLYNHLQDDDIEKIVKNNEPIVAAKELIRLANERGGSDNITVEVVEVFAIDDKTVDINLPPPGALQVSFSGTAEDLSIDVDFDDIEGTLEALQIGEDRFVEEPPESVSDDSIEIPRDEVLAPSTSEDLDLESDEESDLEADIFNDLDSETEPEPEPEPAPEKVEGSAVEGLLFGNTPTLEEVEAHQAKYRRRSAKPQMDPEPTVEAKFDDDEISEQQIKDLKWMQVTVGVALCSAVVGAIYVVGVKTPGLESDFAKINAKRAVTQGQTQAPEQMLAGELVRQRDDTVPIGSRAEPSSELFTIEDFIDRPEQLESPAGTPSDSAWPTTALLQDNKASPELWPEIPVVPGQAREDAGSEGDTRASTEERIREAIERSTDLSIPEVPAIKLANNLSPTPQEEISWERERERLRNLGEVEARRESAPRILITEAERINVGRRKAALRDAILDLDARLKVFSFNSQDAATTALLDLEQELEAVELAIVATKGKLTSAKDRAQKWKAIEQRVQTLVDADLEQVAKQLEENPAVASKLREYAAVVNNYDAAVKRWRANPDDLSAAASMGALGRQIKVRRANLEQTIRSSLEQEQELAKFDIAEQTVVLEDLERRHERLARHIGFTRTYTPAMTPERRMQIQRQLLNERREQITQLDELRRKLPDEEELAIRRVIATSN